MSNAHDDGTHYKRLVTNLETQLDSWQQDAKCRGLSVSESNRLFFPTVRFSYRSPKESEGYTVGKAFCFDCPVKANCLQWAMTWETDNSKRFGLYGGFSPGERATLHGVILNLLPRQSEEMTEFEVTEC